MTDEQKEEQQRQFDQADKLQHELQQLKEQSAAVRQQAQALEHGGSKEDMQALADKLDELGQSARNAQGRLDSAGLPNSSYAYKAIQDMSDYADMAHHEAQGAANATGDNDEVRQTHYSNMMNHIEHGDGPLQMA